MEVENLFPAEIIAGVVSGRIVLKQKLMKVLMSSCCRRWSFEVSQLQKCFSTSTVPLQLPSSVHSF